MLTLNIYHVSLTVEHYSNNSSPRWNVTFTRCATKCWSAFNKSQAINNKLHHSTELCQLLQPQPCLRLGAVRTGTGVTDKLFTESNNNRRRSSSQPNSELWSDGGKQNAREFERGNNKVPSDYSWTLAFRCCLGRHHPLTLIYSTSKIDQTFIPQHRMEWDSHGKQ